MSPPPSAGAMADGEVEVTDPHSETIDQFIEATRLSSVKGLKDYLDDLGVESALDVALDLADADIDEMAKELGM